jgi:hypothetical protein
MPFSARTRPRSPLSLQAARLLALVLCVSAAVWIWALIRGSFDTVDWEVIGTALAASVFAFTAVIGAALVDARGFRHRIGQLTIVLSGIDFGLAVVLIWSQTPGDALARAFEAVSVLLLACVHACLMLRRHSPADPSMVGTLTRLAIGFASAAAVLAAGLIVFVSGSVPSGAARLDGILVVLATLATLLRPLTRRMRGQRQNGEPPRTGGTPPPGDRTLFSVAPPTLRSGPGFLPGTERS